MMNRNEYMDVELAMGIKGLIKKDSVIAVCDVKVPVGTSPETEVTLTNGKIFVYEEYSKFCDRLFAL